VTDPEHEDSSRVDPGGSRCLEPRYWSRRRSAGRVNLPVRTEAGDRLQDL